MNTVEEIKQSLVKLYFNTIDPYNQMTDDDLIVAINNEFDVDISLDELIALRGY